MDQAIYAADANRSFSRLLRDVREGHSYVVTAHGRPVGRIIPCNEAHAAQADARSALLKRLGCQNAVDVGRWTRDDLYER
ncbi:type II toxin-antitoxin system Phd/YefM family antitoxin [Rhodopila sp.]|uniref:type II toxin-antitoxin system Phd/YefM family antitoxin n=1 Tax=Rhodopila sp. TaxID=2480087 RepID=UPI003D0B1CB5